MNPLHPLHARCAVTRSIRRSPRSAIPLTPAATRRHGRPGPSAKEHPNERHPDRPAGAGRPAGLPRTRRRCRVTARTAAAVVALTALAVITVALAYLAARSVT